MQIQQQREHEWTGKAIASYSYNHRIIEAGKDKGHQVQPQPIPTMSLDRMIES